MEVRANPLSGRLIVGIALMALGALWTLDNLDLLDADPVVRWWPLVPLAIGLMKLTGVGMEKQVPFGAFLTIAGGLFLLGEFDLVRVNLGILWPLLFIFIGVQVTMRAMGGSQAAGPAPGQPDADDYVRSFAVMGGITRRNESRAFRGGELTAVMGGVELDLTNAVAAGGRAVVDVFAIWGGIDIRVPDDWRVEIDATPVMAGVESSARLAPGLAATGTLVVRGFVMMGGVDIKNGPLGEKRTSVVVRTGEGRGGVEIRTGSLGEERTRPRRADDAGRGSDDPDRGESR